MEVIILATVKKDLTTKIKDWSAKPFNAKAVPFIFFILFVMSYIIILTMKHIDYDSFFAIAQGREILESGFPKYNNFLFFENYEICIQQWLYCIILTFIDANFDSIGLIIFAALQGYMTFRMFETKISLYAKDKFWSYLLAGLAVLSTNSYIITLRAENITFILLMANSLILEKYRRTDKPGYLYLLPLLTLLEINLHASMWIFHFCILLAHLVPSMDKELFKDNHIKINKHVIFAACLMFGSLFINPYGFKNIAYVFNSLGTFKHIPITEQQLTRCLSMAGVVIAIVIILFTIAVCTRKIKANTIYICLGFVTLSITSFHSAMFLSIALVFLFCDYIDNFNSKVEGQKAVDTMQNSMWFVIALIIFCMIMGCVAIVNNNSLYYFKHQSNMDAIIEYIKTDDPDNSEHILTNIDCGSYLEYNNIKNIFCDTRPEMLNKKINNKEDSMEFVSLFLYNRKPKSFENITDVKSALEYLDIKYIIDYSEEMEPVYTALFAYLDTTDDYRKVELYIEDENNQGNTEKTKLNKYVLYERVDINE